MSNYSTLSARVDLLVQDQGNYLDSNAKMQAFRDGLNRYSRDVPREVLEELTGDGSTWSWSLAATFLPNFSVITQVEYPVDQRPPVYLGFGAYITYPDTSSTMLGLPNITPGAGEKVRVRYTGMHTLSGLDSALATTVPEWHFSGLVSLVASRQLIMLANRFIHEQDSTIDADVMDRTPKVSEAMRMAKELEERYAEMLGVGGGVKPATSVIDWDSSLSGSGVDFLTHPRRWR